MDTPRGCRKMCAALLHGTGAWRSGGAVAAATEGHREEGKRRKMNSVRAIWAFAKKHLCGWPQMAFQSESEIIMTYWLFAKF
ncbi:hypothetical protein GUJ93_ZPchr0002g25062 [Zizania palustris]|uniref:Uncharacterized protein n=1 Tax=Zizania palustris TaxID=103762 RepID=A0A8J5S265_ZIZPA|nr:hypothetical protein GUJ93_ZPchr0002g25062 [Zizania palustris]